MITGTISQAARIVDGRYKAADCVFSGISTDTRTIEPGNLFFALEGERYRGSDFIEDAFNKGAVSVVTSRNNSVYSNVIVVKDTIGALGNLAAWWRGKFQNKVIAISGSAGKTLIRAAVQKTLSSCVNVHGTRGNLNNHIGVPLTLAELNPSEHKVSVIEAAMNHAGELRYLGSIIRPDIVILTNIGSAHLEGLGSLRNIALAKAELLESGPELFIYNGDDHRLRRIARDFPAKSCDYTLKRKKAFCMGRAEYSDEAMPSLTISFDDTANRRNISCKPLIPGMPGAQAALCAATVAECLGLARERWVPALNQIGEQEMRLQMLTVAGRRFIRDCYNANPFSVSVALETMTMIKAGGYAALLGDMLELGRYSVRMHRRIGRMAAQLGVSLLVTYGEMSLETGIQARDNGVKWVHASSYEEAAEALLKYTTEGDMILVKGSRLMALEKVLESIRLKG